MATEADPSNAKQRHDASWTLHQMGTVLEALGRSDEALASYEKALAIRDALVDANPARTDWRRDRDASRAVVKRLR